MKTPRRPGRSRKTEVGEVRTLERGLHLLEVLSEFETLSLSELARRTELSPSTAYRLLETLRRRGFVDWDESRGLWKVGLRAYQVGSAFLTRGGLIEAAMPEMERLVDELNETVNLAVLDGHEVVYIAQVEGRQLIRMFTRIGARAPIYCTGVGKALLLEHTEAEVRRIVGAGPFKPYTAKTITRLEQLLEALKEARRKRYVVDDEEREDGVRCVAAPIHDNRGKVVASMSLSAPATRVPDERLPELGRRIRQAADAVSARLGWSPVET
ncbi:IclR family transcriptional regulator [Meiothermus sp. QL-1]|uniref:IclR family transcriptional regulator n=1 Tax=Meiothermus sp. QL-1 TaxID=2058095 RepID=UPI000E0C89AA|nr:IclR family transcriptional regulator [Meiothermus sp. QL-1]RDI95929.1 IclR family transcriptional regulator [Meiothermus sp. QL-1]